MEVLRFHGLELWNATLLMYRKRVIKAECKRRRAIANSRYWSDKCSSKAKPICDHNQSGSHQDSHIDIVIADVSAASTAATPGGITYYSSRSEMKRVFDLVDGNKDGLISVEELQLHLKRLGLEFSYQKVREMVLAVDRNNDEYVDFEEFYALYSSPNGDLSAESSTSDSPIASVDEDGEDEEEEEEALLKAFFVFDQNKDGLISAKELQQVLLKLGIPEGRSLMSCEKMIAKVDADGNGKVDFFEFRDMMCSNVFNI